MDETKERTDGNSGTTAEGSKGQGAGKSIEKKLRDLTEAANKGADGVIFDTTQPSLDPFEQPGDAGGAGQSGEQSSGGSSDSGSQGAPPPDGEN